MYEEFLNALFVVAEVPQLNIFLADGIDHGDQFIHLFGGGSGSDLDFADFAAKDNHLRIDADFALHALVEFNLLDIGQHAADIIGYIVEVEVVAAVLHVEQMGVAGFGDGERQVF